MYVHTTYVHDQSQISPQNRGRFARLRARRADIITFKIILPSTVFLDIRSHEKKMLFERKIVDQHNV